MKPTAGEAHAAAGLEGHRYQDPPRPEGPAGDARRRRLRRSGDARLLFASPATCSSAMSRALQRIDSYKAVAFVQDGSLDQRDATARGPQVRPMNGRGVIVGVDVGGTFTDLFLLDSTRRACSAPPRCRRAAAMKPQASSTDLQRSAAQPSMQFHRAWHHGRHQHAAGAARAERIGVIATRGFRDDAGDAPPRPPAHLGPVGRFRADRRPRPARSRSTSGRWPTARSGQAVDAWTRSARRLRRFCSRRGAEAAGDHRSSTPMPTRRTRARALASRRATSGRTSIITASHQVLPGDPRVRARLDRGAEQLLSSRWSASYLGKLECGSRDAELCRQASTSCSRTAA